MAVDMKRVRAAIQDHLEVACENVSDLEVVGYMEVAGGNDVVVLTRFNRAAQKGEESNLPPTGVASFYVQGNTNAVKLFVVA